MELSCECGNETEFVKQAVVKTIVSGEGECLQWKSESNIEYYCGNCGQPAETCEGTPAEDRYGRDYCNPCSHPELRMHVGCNKCPQREPDKVKPLAQYLAEYLEHNKYDFTTIDRRYGDTMLGIDMADLRNNIKQALDTYESTEQVKIRIERV